MKMKKFILLFSTVVISTGSLFANGQSEYSGNGDNGFADNVVSKSGFPIVDETVSIKVLGVKAPIHGDWQDMLVFNEYEKMTNVKVEFQQIPQSGYAKRMNILFAAGDLPDAFVRCMMKPVDVAKYGSDGYLFPLNELIDKGYAPNIKKIFDMYPEVKSSVTSPDGNIYVLPGVVTLNSARTEKTWINMEWLNKLGLSIPKSIEEYKRVLEAFRDNDMNGDGTSAGEIPLTGRNIDHIINCFAGSFGLQLQLNYNINIEDEKINVWFDDERYKQLLMYLADLYQNDLLDREIFVNQNKDFFKKLDPTTTGAFFNQADDIFSQYEGVYQGIATLKGYNEYQIQNSRPIARDFGTFAMSATNKYPEATLRWIDFFYGNEGSLFFRMGVLDDTYKLNSEGEYVYTDKILNDSRGVAVAIGQMTIWPGGNAPHLINDENSVAINSRETSKAQEVIEPYMLKKVYATPIFSNEDQSELTALQTDIESFTDEALTMFIIGSKSFDEWDVYVETLEKMGIDRLEEIYQKAYDGMK